MYIFSKMAKKIKFFKMVAFICEYAIIPFSTPFPNRVSYLISMKGFTCHDCHLKAQPGQRTGRTSD